MVGNINQTFTAYFFIAALLLLDCSDKIKWKIFQPLALSVLLYICSQANSNKILEVKAVYFLKQILELTPVKTAVLQPLTSYLTNHPSKRNKTCWALQEK